jgi:hypothetical protein
VVPASTESLTKQVSGRFSGLSEHDAEAVGASFVADIPHLVLVDHPPTFGEVTIEELPDNGSLRLGPDVSTFRPAGRLYSRTAGQFRVFLAVAAESLSGIVRADPTLQAVGMDDDGIHILLQATQGPGCGACGVCGTCVMCAEINYAVAGVAAVALVALQVEPSEELPQFAANAPEPPSTESAGRLPKAELAAEVRQRVRPCWTSRTSSRASPSGSTRDGDRHGDPRRRLPAGQPDGGHPPHRRRWLPGDDRRPHDRDGGVLPAVPGAG